MTTWLGLVTVFFCATVYADSIDEIVDALQKRNPERAIELVTSLPQPLSEETCSRLENAMKQLSPQGEWIPFMELLAKKTGDRGEFLFFLSQACWRAGDVDSAMELSRQAMHASPNDPLLLYKCAAIARTSGKLEDAKQRIESILQAYPDHLDSLFLWGSILLEEGKVEQAREKLTQVIERQADHFRALYELGKLESREGKNEEAVRFLQRAVQVYPFFREAYSAMRTPLSRLKQKSEFDRVQRILDRTRTWNPNKYNRLRYSFEHGYTVSATASVELARELVSVEREDLAKQYLENLFQRKQVDDTLKLLLGQLRFNRKELGGALEMLDSIQDSAIRDSADYQGLRAWLFLQQGKIPESREIIIKYGEKYEDSPHFLALKNALDSIPHSAASSIQDSTVPETNSLSPIIRFVDSTEKAGLSGFHHTLGNPDKRWIVDAMGSGVAVGDYDNDGDDDIFFVNGRPLPDTPDPHYRDALYRNDGGVFADTTETAGVGDPGFGMCAVFGDVDNDGWLDLFVGNRGSNTFYRNQGDGTFRDDTETAGLRSNGYAAAAAFGDVDGDGDLDLFVGNYVDFDPNRDRDRRANYHGQSVMMGPMAFPGQPDCLYVNDGKGHFRDIAEEAGIHVSENRAMGAALFDMDNDGDLDLYVANDSTYNHVLKNDGRGKFEDVGFPSGAAVCENGQDGASMGVAIGDINNDEALDILVTSYELESDVLFVNQGNGEYRDRSGPMGLVAATRWLTTWGVGFCDFDANGFLDSYTVNGHTYPQVEALNVDRHYRQGISIYRNTGESMKGIAAQAVASVTRPFAGRGSALIDYDQDGDMDIVINCIDDSPLLLENTSSTGNWLQMRLVGTSAQTLGVRVVARNGKQTWTRMVDGGSGYLSQNSSTMHFGFGQVDRIDEITVYWMGIPPQAILNPSLNRLLTIPYPASVPQ